MTSCRGMRRAIGTALSLSCSGAERFLGLAGAALIGDDAAPRDSGALVWGGTMKGRNVTRVDLYEAVYQKVGLSRSETSFLVELILKQITDTLAEGETVKLSSFGTFIVRKKEQRIGRNPKTGLEVAISPRRVIVFKPSPILKRQVNEKRSGTKTPATELDSSASAR